MVVKKVMPIVAPVQNSPAKVTTMVNEKPAELPIHPALAQVPDDVNVQDDFERVIYNHAKIDAKATLAELEKVAVNSHIIKEIERPSMALRCAFCHARAQFRLYVTNLFNNVLVCEQDARKQLFPSPVVEEQKEEVVDVNSADTASTDGAISTGSETGTVEVPESQSNSGQTGEAVSNTP